MFTTWGLPNRSPGPSCRGWHLHMILSLETRMNTVKAELQLINSILTQLPSLDLQLRQRKSSGIVYGPESEVGELHAQCVWKDGSDGL